MTDVKLAFGGKPLFEGVTFTLAKGERAALVGRNGAGKSTLLRMIAGLLAFVVPIFILLVLPFSHVLAVFAILSHIAGVFAARWLFFAEAEHVVGLYYGKR